MIDLTLADRFTSHPIRGVVNDDLLNRVAVRVRAARKFVLNADVSRLLGEFVLQYPERIAAASSMIRCPHALMFVELDNRVFWETVNQREGSRDTMDYGIGYLFDNDHVYAMARNSSDIGACLWPVRYDLHQPWSEKNRDAFRDLTFLTTDEYLWGSSTYRLPAELRGSLGENHSASLMSGIHQKAFRTHRLRGVMNEGSADLRNIVAVLMLMSGELGDLTLTPSGRRGVTFSRGKTLRLGDYVSVMHVTRRSNVAGSPGGGGGKPVEHRRGHWVHDREARAYADVAGCVHEWVPVTDFGKLGVENQRFRCKACDGKRWWRSEIDRGEGDGGVVRVVR